MNKIQVIDTNTGMCFKSYSNVVHIETLPECMEVKITYIHNGELRIQSIGVGPDDNNKVVIY